MDRTTGNGGRSLTTCAGRPRYWPNVVSQPCGCSSVGRARPCHGRGHEFETRHPLHFGCVLALRGRVTWCWRCGMCATLARPRAARHRIRRDARVRAQPKWTSLALVAQLAEQPPCKRQAASSNRRRGRQLIESRSSRRLRTLDFQSGDAGSNPARDASTQKPSSSSRSGGGNRPRT